MREFWTFIGGVAVGILAVTGVFATEEENRTLHCEGEGDEMEELEDEVEEETDEERKLIVRSS